MSSPGTLKQDPESLNPTHFSNNDLPLYGPNSYSDYDPQPPTLPSQRDAQQQQHLDPHAWKDQQNLNPNLAGYYSGPEDQAPIYDFGDNINPADLSLMGHPDPAQQHSGHSSHHSTPSLQIPQQQQQVSSPPQQPGSANMLSSGSSTAFEWDNVYSQQQVWGQHRRAPSEYSDISSAAASPYLQNQEFTEQASPLLQGGSSMQDLLGFDGFSLNERELSPRISPQPGQGLPSESNSPYLMPQQYMEYVPSMGSLGSSQQMMEPPAPAGHGAGGQEPAGLGVKTEPNTADDSMAPQINVIFAPPQRQPTFPHSKPGLTLDDQALSPPPKSPRQRQRSKSDPFAAGSGPQITRPLSPTSSPGSGANSPAGGRSRRNSLSPTDVITAPVGSPSSATAHSASSKASSRRSSTSSLPNRDYILELAHPNRPGATPGDNKRVQKHPATFQCTLCPKKFTRAYNLRSHLRTHTDERPFVCTVCGKAFARQHDRKRHEGLHSGEKKFVCRGTLKAGGNWGCGRRFARADALGRHFRSEAGRVCIRPLLDEETAERQRKAAFAFGGGGPGGHMLDPNMHHPHALPHADMSGLAPPPMDPASLGGMVFPSALLEQYPALAHVDWAAADAAGDMDSGGGGMESASGRSSFDASADEWGSTGGGSNRNSFDGSGGDWSAHSSARNSFDGAGWGSDGGGGTGGGGIGGGGMGGGHHPQGPPVFATR